MLNENGIIYKTRFTNTLLLQNKLWPNDTEVSLHMIPQTDDFNHQQIAYEKYKYVFAKILQNSIFVNDDSKEIKSISKFNNQIVDFFTKPVDQIVGVCLLKKLNSIAGEYLHVETVEIESWQGENLKFIISENSTEYELMVADSKKNSWVYDASPRFNNFGNKNLTWNDLGFTISDKNDSFRIIKGGL